MYRELHQEILRSAQLEYALKEKKSVNVFMLYTSRVDEVIIQKEPDVIS